MITLAVLAAGGALVLVILAWSLCRVAATADRRRPEPCRCARCNQPTLGTQLFCSPACQLLFLEGTS